MAGAEAGWRMVVHIGPGQPELRAALANLPPRARAERLRQLALVGLCSLRREEPAATSLPAPQPPETETALTARRERLMHALTVEGE